MSFATDQKNRMIKKWGMRNAESTADKHPSRQVERLENDIRLLYDMLTKSVEEKASKLDKLEREYKSELRLWRALHARASLYPDRERSPVASRENNK